MNNIFFLPESHREQEVDVLLITGDAYIDHPSFGISIIARILNNEGYSICIVSQPPYHKRDFLNLLPTPKLFIGITAGNLDSIVSNYTGRRHRREKDDYSIDGKTQFDDGIQIRPDRASIVYSSFFKQQFKNIPIVLGGLEASLRKFVHYDYVQQKLRNSILIDSKADILVYSMGEKAILEITSRIKKKQSLFGINGTCVKASLRDIEQFQAIRIPSMKDIEKDSYNLIEATKTIEANMVFGKSDNLYQEQGDGSFILNFKPQPPLSQKELDDVYSLPFRKDYPEYCNRVPAWNMINNSITSHRGCYGRCSFCAITSHHGPVVVSRSEKSVLNEVKELTKKPFFKKTVTDIGGPTANMYGTSCKIGWCKDPHCLFPKICENLILNDQCYKSLLEKAKQIDGVKNVFVTSGLRHDIAIKKTAETNWIIRNAVSGHLKIAPENIDNDVLRLMKKPPTKIFSEFIQFFNMVKKENKLNIYLLPYFILSHPGSSTKSVEKLIEFLNTMEIKVQQFQDFTPTPQTLSTAMFVSKKDMNGNEISIPNPSSIKNKQREMLESRFKKDWTEEPTLCD